MCINYNRTYDELKIRSEKNKSTNEREIKKENQKRIRFDSIRFSFSISFHITLALNFQA